VFTDGWITQKKVEPLKPPMSLPIPSPEDIDNAVDVFRSACANKHVLTKDEYEVLCEAATNLDKFWQGMKKFSNVADKELERIYEEGAGMSNGEKEKE
jgi:hypothetical protein